MTPDEALSWAADYLETADKDESAARDSAILSIAHSLWALAALQVKRPSPGRPVETPDSIPLPVASPEQIAQWTGRIVGAPDSTTLAQILDDLMGYAMPASERDDLTSMAWERRLAFRA